MEVSRNRLWNDVLCAQNAVGVAQGTVKATV
jgi:hypothetical protein